MHFAHCIILLWISRTINRLFLGDLLCILYSLAVRSPVRPCVLYVLYKVKKLHKRIVKKRLHFGYFTVYKRFGFWYYSTINTAPSPVGCGAVETIPPGRQRPFPWGGVGVDRQANIVN